MAGSITPLPVLLEEDDRKIYEKLEAPKSMVVRYGYMRLIAELPYDGEAKPGCGSQLVIRTSRGIELATMLTSTCPNSGCGHAVSRKQMLQYIENSGGRDYPFTTQGRILRVATVEDMNDQAQLDGRRQEMVKRTKALIAEYQLPMKLVEIELLLGGDRVLFHYTSEDWVDFRELVRRLASEYQTRIEMHQVNARDEARIVADYEKCGQHCCCKQFLKVLKPVSMRSAKVQKATLDPTKISGRCGRLMCCLRYEDETYEDLRKRLPNRKSRVCTDEGTGTVIDSQILTQLILVELDATGKRNAYPLENIEILSKGDAGYEQVKAPVPPPRAPRAERTRPPRPAAAAGPEPRRPSPGKPLAESEVESREGDRGIDIEPRAATSPADDDGGAPPENMDASQATGDDATDKPKRGRRRRRRRRGGGGGEGSQGGGGPAPAS